MKRKQRIVVFLSMVAVALSLAACGGDSGNNSSGFEGKSSSSVQFSSSSQQLSSSSVVKSSNSSSEVSNSSEIASSSSIEVCVNTYGTNTVKDCRDNHTYKIVLIGAQTWMAENLNYAVDSSWCYGNSTDSCAKYGRLYQWASAMGLSTTYNKTFALGWGQISASHQGACPAGWHIPTDEEWTTLESTVGGSVTLGTVLKNTSGWDNNGNGTDAYGFSALPAGNRSVSGDFYNAVTMAYFWSATEHDAGYAYDRSLTSDETGVYTSSYSKFFARSVRCLFD